jgi:small GTP-binding protein
MAPFKIVLLGEGRVGKTSLVTRFVNDTFDDAQASTIQAMMFSKKKVTIDGECVDLAIWDTAGQERFHALGPIYYRNADGAVLVYDITDADTLEKVKLWVKELKAVVGDGIHLVICGNKADMQAQRDVDELVAQRYAAVQGAVHFNTSAKLNVNVSEAFTALARAIVSSVGPSQTKRRGKGSAKAAVDNNGVSVTRKKKGLQIEASDHPSSYSEASSSGAAEHHDYGSAEDYNETVSDRRWTQTKPSACSVREGSNDQPATDQSKGRTVTLEQSTLKGPGAPRQQLPQKKGCCSN